ncbi:hypothetical protein [Kitasatospora sp. NPDC017646]|uniref:hypothetical protein n=1 Tax=Kitasatospora sp. NPDC017646 TaxID=3364024 RepID=UPI00378F4933
MRRTAVDWAGHGQQQQGRAATAEYDGLIARHHAMRLRSQLLTPAAPLDDGPGAYTGSGGREGYDGAGDQHLIRRDLDLVAPIAEPDLYDWQALSELGLHKPWLSLTPVTAGRLADIVAAAGDWREHLACVSGPAGMVASARSELLAVGLPLARVRFDQVLTR